MKKRYTLLNSNSLKKKINPGKTTVFCNLITEMKKYIEELATKFYVHN